MSVLKDFCERYTVANKGEYASIALRCWTRPSVGERAHCAYGGEIMVHSSYGSWGYTWNACGIPFKEFLCKLHFDYLFSKFMGSDLERFDGAGSIASVMSEMLTSRRRRTLDKADAREIWNGLTSFEANLCSTASEFVNAMQDLAHEISGEVSKEAAEYLDEPWLHITTRSDSQAEGFWRDLWPEFVGFLQSEIKADVSEKQDLMAA